MRARRSGAGADVDCDAFEVAGPAPRHAGVDGEAVDLTPPLRFVIRPGALRVRLPQRP